MTAIMMSRCIQWFPDGLQLNNIFVAISTAKSSTFEQKKKQCKRAQLPNNVEDHFIHFLKLVFGKNYM